MAAGDCKYYGTPIPPNSTHFLFSFPLRSAVCQSTTTAIKYVEKLSAGLSKSKCISLTVCLTFPLYFLPKNLFCPFQFCLFFFCIKCHTTLQGPKRKPTHCIGQLTLLSTFYRLSD